LITYYQDDLQFKGPHYARTINIVHKIGDEDKAYIKEITHPVHITVADGDNVLDIGEIKKFFETVKTPEDLKDIEHYDSDHFILSDGWLYEEVADRQCKWLSKVLGKESSPHM
jgi:esterase/lipase